MNKKILIGSIIAVVILVLVSFTGVVGFQSVKSTSAINSPLFYVRSSRVLNEESKDLSCDYIGKGKVTNIRFSQKEGTTIKHILDIIKVMDDKTFSIFMNLAIRELLKNNIINYSEIHSTIKALKELREGDINFIPNTNELLQTTGSECWTYRCVTVQCNTAFAGCIRYELLMDGITITYALFPNLMNVITFYLNPLGPFRLSFACPSTRPGQPCIATVLCKL